MERMKKLIAMLLCVVMTAAFVPAFAGGAEAATVYTSAAGQVDGDVYTVVEEYFIELVEIADVELGDTYTIQTTADSVLLETVMVVVTRTAADGTSVTIYMATHTAEEIANGLTCDLPNDAAVGDVYTVVVSCSDVISATAVFAVVGEAKEYNPVLSGLDSMTVVKNKTKLYTGTGQDIPDGATVTFTATIADETYATIDSIIIDDTNHVYVTVKGVKKGTTTMTITMVVDDGNIVYTAAKEVTVNVKTPSYDYYYTIDYSILNDGVVSVTKNMSYNGGGVLIVAKYNDGALIDKEIIEITDMSDGETKEFQSSLTAGEGEILKMFIWKSVDSMSALSDVEAYEE